MTPEPGFDGGRTAAWDWAGVPEPPALAVQRQRLVETLDEATRRRVTLLVAPAGFGKTALLTTWVNTRRDDIPVAWVSLYPMFDRNVFWRLVCRAFDRILGGNELESLVDEDTGPEELVPRIVEAVGSRGAVLILDDLHEVADPAIEDDVALLVRQAPALLHTVVVSRRRPPFSIERMRLAGDLTEITREDLAFRLGEAEELVRDAGIVLSPAQVRRLWDRTAGWPAALQLLILTLRTHRDPGAFVAAFRGDEAILGEYMVEEVVGRQPPEIRDFLFVTAVPELVSGDLATALGAGASAGRTLVDLHRSGMLITALDGRGEWFRYHPLLQAYLRRAFQGEDAVAVRNVHRRAAAWYEEQGDWLSAIRHGVAAEDWASLRSMVGAHWMEMITAGDTAAFGELLLALPQEHLRNAAPLALMLSVAALEAADVDRADGWLALADGAEHDPEVARIAAVVALYRGRVTGDVDAARTAARQILRELSNEALLVDPEELTLRAVAFTHLGSAEFWAGEQEEAREHLQAGAETAAQSDRLTVLRVMALSHLAVHRTLVLDLEGARDIAEEALQLAESGDGGGPIQATLAHTVTMTVALLRGDLPAARAGVERLLQLAGRHQTPPVRCCTGVALARTALVDGRPTDALEHLDNIDVALAGSSFGTLIRPYAVLVRTRALAALSRPEAARATVERELERGCREVGLAPAETLLAAGEDRAALECLEDDAVVAHRFFDLRAELHLLRGIAHRRLGERAAAQTEVAAALELTASRDCVLPFMELAVDRAEVVELLADTVDYGSPHRPLVARIRAMANDAPILPEDALADEDVPLSERELAVLQYLPSQLTNREIADELCVSVNTVKTHVRQIYMKLGAGDRSEAVRRARGAGLLHR